MLINWPLRQLKWLEKDWECNHYWRYRAIFSEQTGVDNGDGKFRKKPCNIRYMVFGELIKKLTDKPGSVVDSHSSRPELAHWLKQPTRVQYGPYHVNPYLALLRVEFTLPQTVTSRAVCSYHTLSPLPDPIFMSHWRFALCCTCRRFAPPRHYLAPCPMEPGLSSPSSVSLARDSNKAATVWSTSREIIVTLH